MNCNHKKTLVIDTRKRNNYRYRRHQCIYCNHRFSTVEMPVEEMGRGSDAGIISLQKKLGKLTNREISAVLNLVKIFKDRDNINEMV